MLQLSAQFWMKWQIWTLYVIYTCTYCLHDYDSLEGVNIMIQNVHIVPIQFVCHVEIFLKQLHMCTCSIFYLLLPFVISVYVCQSILLFIFGYFVRNTNTLKQSDGKGCNNYSEFICMSSCLCNMYSGSCFTVFRIKENCKKLYFRSMYLCIY